MTEDRNETIERLLLNLGDLGRLRIQSMCSQPFLREISLLQLHVLAFLRERGPLTVSEMAQIVQVSLPSASSIADRMEDRGYITRVRTDADRRVVTVAITDRGREAVEEFVSLKREGMLRLLTEMNDDELYRFASGMEALQAAVARVPAPVAAAEA